MKTMMTSFHLYKINLTFLIILSFFLFSCDQKTQNQSELKQIRVFTKDSPLTEAMPLRCDTIRTVYTPMHYTIHLSNRFTDSLITSSLLDMKEYMTIEYSLDTILPKILDHKHIYGIDLNNIDKAQFIRNEFEFIRTPSLYFNLDFTIDDDTFNIVYAVRYAQNKKYSFWHHRGLLNPN